MPAITDIPPEAIRSELKALCLVLDEEIPAKVLDRNLLIATWNLRMFGDLTEKWQSEEEDVPRRDLQSLRCITEIVSRFDVIALQEVRGKLKCLRHMLKVLGPNWSFLLTDVTQGSPGNDERLAFLFDTRRVKLSGLACELVVPEEQLDAGVSADALRKQFARTPYAVSFWASGKTFILVTLHVLFGSKSADRLPELTAIAKWLAGWAKDINAYDQNLIALGDFNIDRHNDPTYQAFTSTGLTPPADLNNVPRTLFSDPAQPNLSKYYDQIAWFNGQNGMPMLSLEYLNGGGFDFLPHVLRTRGLSKAQLSYMISDHYPLWTQFSIRD